MSELRIKSGLHTTIPSFVVNGQGQRRRRRRRRQTVTIMALMTWWCPRIHALTNFLHVVTRFRSFHAQSPVIQLGNKSGCGCDKHLNCQPHFNRVMPSKDHTQSWWVLVVVVIITWNCLVKPPFGGMVIEEVEEQLLVFKRWLRWQ